MEEDSTKELSNNEMFRLILARLDSMDTRLTTLEEKVDRRLTETRPIWESVLEQLKETNARLDKVEMRLDSLEIKVNGIEKRVNNFDLEANDFHSWLRKNYFELGKEQVRFDDRLEKLEETVLPRQ